MLMPNSVGTRPYNAAAEVKDATPPSIDGGAAIPDASECLLATDPVPRSDEHGQGKAGGEPGGAGHDGNDPHPEIVFVQGQSACGGMAGENRNQSGH
jgi:hypothetical protein